MAKSLAKELKTELGNVILQTFSCGEQYVRYKQSLRGHDVFIMQSVSENPHKDLMELFLMCQAARLSFARTVHVIMPYFPYARQDRVALPREPISAKLLAQLLQKAGADHLITLDLHSDQIQGFFSIPVDVLSATEWIFTPYFKNKKIKDPVVVSPDVGGAKRAKRFADAIGADLAIMHKSRPAHNEAEILEVVGEVEGRACLIFDDMIDTAGSLVSAKKALTERGADSEVIAVATHGIFSGPAAERLNKAEFKEIVVTDTIAQTNKISALTVLPTAPCLAEVITRVQSGKSVTQL